MAKTCQICGKPSGMYPLCPACFKLRDAGEVIKCEECKTWHKKDQPCQCSNEKNKQTPVETSICIICGKEAHGKKQCPSCYEETLGFLDQMNKNSTIREFRDYYYNLKDRILIMKSLETTQQYCNKLIAIALAAEKYCRDTSLTARVYENCISLIESKKTVPIQEQYKEEKKEQDETKAKIHTAQDGHIVKSDMEVIVDNALYNLYLLHVYEPNVPEITESRKKADWFIPICNGEGIYIEYWGMDTKSYLKTKAERIALYEKHNLPLIGIEKDDPKGDYQTFINNLKRDITKLATERYGFMPGWKR